MDIARQKIVELQKKLSELNNKNINVEDENNRLNGRLARVDNEIKGVQQKIIPNKTENNITTKSTPTNTIFTVSHLHVTAIRSTDGVEKETTRADHTDKIDGIITLESNFTQLSSAEIIVVVLQPDGRVMQGSSWESGTLIHMTEERFIPLNFALNTQ